MIDTERHTMTHTRPNPNVCPFCGEENTLRELDAPTRWQDVTMRYSDDGTTLTPDEYPSTWSVSDEGDPRGYECGGCYTEWRDVYDLALDQRRAHALTEYVDYWQLRGERLRDLASGDRLDTVNGAEKIADADARADAYRHALDIIRGNGEA